MNIVVCIKQVPDTKGVGEGYCKAFQYLCDLSTFNKTQVYSVTGMIEGSDISGLLFYGVP